MKTRYMKGSTPLPERLKDQATHSIELSDAKYKAYTSSKYFTETRVKTSAELSLMEEDKLKKDKIDGNKRLRESCERYQIYPGKCNANFFALLMGASAAAKATGVEPHQLVTDCRKWLDSLWNIYYTRESTEDWDNEDFSEVGEIPHSFIDVRAVAE